jgi:hypothetical protein
MADQRTKRCSDLSQLAVVIPCHNEEHTILQVVDSLPKGLGQWLVVDNGSSASCRELLQEHLPADHLLIVEEPLGVGGAFLAGCEKLKEEIRWICKLDGDDQFADVALGPFLEQATISGAALVKTARCNRLGWGIEPQRSLSRHWGNQLVTMVLAVASGYYLLEDGTSGLFVIERSALDAARARGGLRHDHGFETALLLNLGCLGASLLELRIPIRYSPNRRRTFQGRAMVKPLLGCLVCGLNARLLGGHLVYRLSPGGLLLLSSGSLLAAGSALIVFATVKALSMGMPTTPGISAAATSLMSLGILAGVGFLVYDFAATFRRYRNATIFDCWQPIATQGIQATRNHQPKRPS